MNADLQSTIKVTVHPVHNENNNNTKNQCDLAESHPQKKVRIDSKGTGATPGTKQEEKKLSNEIREDTGDEIRFTLGEKKKISVGRYKKQVLVNIREFYDKNGASLPTKKGCAFSVETWETLKDLIPDIDQVIKEFKENNK